MYVDLPDAALGRATTSAVDVLLADLVHAGQARATDGTQSPRPWPGAVLRRGTHRLVRVAGRRPVRQLRPSEHGASWPSAAPADCPGPRATRLSATVPARQSIASPGDDRAHGGGRRPRAAHLPARQGVLPRPRRHQVRPRLVLPRDRRPPAQHRRRAARHAAALPRRRRPASPSTKSASRPARPDWLQSTTVSTPNGTTSNALVVADIAHVVWAVNIGCLGLHLWPYLAADPAHADELRIDLDPTTGIGFDEVRAAALRCRDVLDELGLRGLPQDDGQPRLARLRPARATLGLGAGPGGAVALARELERRYPDQITANWWKEERGSRVFVDFNQNAPHKTVFGAWFARPRTGGQVSTPLTWDEVETVVPDELDHPHRAGPGAPAGRPLGRHRRAAPVARAPARAGRAGQGGRPARRAVATASTPRCPTSRPGWRPSRAKKG